MNLSVLVGIVLIPVSVFAQDVNQDALKKTQNLLKDQSAREKAIDTQAAKDSAANVKQLSGGDAKSEQEMYEIAAEILPALMKETEGDPKRMQEYLENQKSNPIEFMGRLPADQQARIKALAEKIAESAKTKP